MLERGRGGVIVLAVLAALGLVATAAAWALAHVGVQITLDDTVLVGIERQVPFRARVRKPMQIALDEALTTHVKLQEL